MTRSDAGWDPTVGLAAEVAVDRARRDRAAASRVVARIAGEEYRRALESRGVLGFSTLLVALVLGLSYFGLAQSRELGAQGFARLTLSLMSLVLFLVPLAGLLLGVTAMTSGAGTLPLLLAQPVGRGQVFVGKFLGLAAAITVAQALGFGAGGAVIALQAGLEEVHGFLVLTMASFALGWITVAAAMFLAVLWPDRLRAMSAAMGLWVLMVVAYDLAVLGATAVLRGVPLQSVLFPALLANPVDLARVLTTVATGSGALFGPTSAVLVRVFGTPGGAALCVGVLALDLVVPLALGAWIFRRRDW
jgi:Cu-processing system permease protein